MFAYQPLTETIGDLDEEKVIGMLKELVTANLTTEEGEKIIAACEKGMQIVGERYESGEYFVSELIFAGDMLTQAIDILMPVIDSSSSKKICKIVLGTVRGDLHDIGKNIFRSMADAAGFEIYDLGIDQPVDNFVKKIKEVKPKIVGLSGVLTIAIEAMKETIEALQAAGLRNEVKIIIGGNPITKEACTYVGADAYTNNAVEGVRICKGWVN